MLTELLSMFQGAQLQTWGILAVGFLSTALAFAVGRVLFRRRRAPGPSPLPKGPNHLQTDLFLEGGTSERRQALRRLGKPIKVIISDAATQAEYWEGWVLDRSLSGIRLSVPQKMALGTRLSVRAESGDRSTWVFMEVRHCRPLENRWAVGCEFAPGTPWGALLMFG